MLCPNVKCAIVCVRSLYTQTRSHTHTHQRVPLIGVHWSCMKRCQYPHTPPFHVTHACFLQPANALRQTHASATQNICCATLSFICRLVAITNMLPPYNVLMYCLHAPLIYSQSISCLYNVLLKLSYSYLTIGRTNVCRYKRVKRD